MPIVKCLNCGKISTSDAEVICLRCNADLSASRHAAASSKGFSVSLPAGLDLKKIGIGIAAVIVGAIMLSFLWSWKTERAKKNAERKETEMVANFDYVRFDNNEGAIQNAFKLMPAKFNVKPPEFEAFKSDLSAEMSKKNHDNYTSTQRQNGTFQQKQNLTPTYNQGQVIGSSGDAVMTTGGPGPSSVNVEFKRFEKVETKHANKYIVMDLSIADFNYVKAPADKLVCFVKYTAKMGQFQSSSTIEPYSLNQPRQPENPHAGTKIRDWTANENARYELENDKWVLKQAGISELDKMRQIDELKAASAKAPAQN